MPKPSLFKRPLPNTKLKLQKSEGSGFSKGLILAALPKLSRADLAVIATACQHLMGAAASAPPEATPAMRLLFTALSAAVGVPITYVQFAKTATFKHFTNNAPVMLNFVHRYFDGAERKQTTHLAIFKLLIGLIAADLIRRGVPATLGTVTINLPRIAEVFDQAFPNYRESGLTGLVLKQMRITKP